MSKLPLSLLLVLLTAAAVGAADLPCPSGWSPNEGGLLGARAAELGLDATIRGALESAGATPGLAVGVVSKGEVLYARGFGVAELDGCTPVTPESSFYLLSVTKSFLGMAAARLQEEGEFELDRSLSHYFPELVLEPPLNAAQISVRDLLNHRSGLRNGTINYRTFISGDMNGPEILRVLRRYSQPRPITFDYSNTSYILAALAIERATGLGWRELIERRIFEPLGMTSSTTSIELARRGAFARPYRVTDEGGFKPAPIKVQEQMHAAGGTASNVVDLLRWLEANLEGGRIDGREVLPPRALRQAHAPQIQYDWQYGRYRRFAHGLGIHNSDLDGELVLHHFGGPIHLSFAPEHRLGLVLLSAGPDSTGFVHGLAASLYDLLLDKEDAAQNLTESLSQASTRLEERLERRRRRDAELSARRAPIARAADLYSGTYVSDRLGTLTVTDTGDALAVEYGVLRLPLESLEKDAFLVRIPNDRPYVFTFDNWRDERPATLDWEGRPFERVR